MTENMHLQERMPIEIDTARPEDAEGIMNVQKVTWLATYPNDKYGITYDDIATKVKQWGTPESLAELRESIQSPADGTLRLVAKDGDKVIGHCFVKKLGDINKLQVLYVLPEYQGSGVGTRLASEGLAWLGNNKDIALEVVKYNVDTIKFYEKLGFEIRGDAHNPAATLPSGMTMPEYQMIKRASSY